MSTLSIGNFRHKELFECKILVLCSIVLEWKIVSVLIKNELEFLSTFS
ncbi:hypothetical protein LEP1GSC092_3062 [Leptospira interrogans serovar Pyrogenes str. R168]|nr:hypothetical protein LEP1GSC092_3062 [Leptospira interrogans serovar Pyrogenes str. R168]